MTAAPPAPTRTFAIPTEEFAASHQSGPEQVDAFLAAALRPGAAPWPENCAGNIAARVAERAIFHGIAGLLIHQRADLAGWPEPVLNRLMERARGQTIWEMRHQIIVTKLLAQFARAGILAILLKGILASRPGLGRLYPDCLRIKGPGNPSA